MSLLDYFVFLNLSNISFSRIPTKMQWNYQSLLLVFVHVQSENDCRFAFDAACLAKFAEVRGFSHENIKIRGKVI